MSEEIKAEGRAFAAFLQTLPESERIKGNEAERERVETEFKQFKEAYHKDCCYLCNKPFTSFSKKSPCIHWLLKPKGFKKKDFKRITSAYGYFQIQSYLRWLANQSSFARNINDLPEERTGTKLFEVTIRFRNLEWSFSCAPGDYDGHGTSQHGTQPHYHFQMRVDKKPFIDFGDFHVPFSKMDIINIEAMQTLPNLYKQRYSFGEGMKEVLRDDLAEQIVNTTVAGDDYDEAPFKIDTIAMAEEGKSISGDDLYNIIQEAKAKGVTVASLMHKLPNAQAQIFISPGPGVVEQAPRTGRKKDK